MANYIKEIRNYVGNKTIFLNFVTAIIENENNEILLQRRSDKNKWGFLGGAIELGESAEEAVVREVKEESDLNIMVTNFFGVYTKYFDSYPSGDKAQPILIVFKCKILSGELSIKSDETLELKYFKLADVPPLVNIQHEDILTDLKNGLQNVYR